MATTAARAVGGGGSGRSSRPAGASHRQVDPVEHPGAFLATRPGYSFRHVAMLVDREQFVASILDGAFVEHDLTEEQPAEEVRAA